MIIVAHLVAVHDMIDLLRGIDGDLGNSVALIIKGRQLFHLFSKLAKLYRSFQWLSIGTAHTEIVALHVAEPWSPAPEHNSLSTVARAHKDGSFQLLKGRSKARGSEGIGVVKFN